MQELRNKHRPSVISSIKDRAKGLAVWTDTDGLTTKLYNFKRDPEPLVSISDSADQLSDVGDGDANQESDLGNMDDIYGGVTVNAEIDSLPDPKDQVDFSIIFSKSYNFVLLRVVSCVPAIFFSLCLVKSRGCLVYHPKAVMFCCNTTDCLAEVGVMPTARGEKISCSQVC